MADLNKVFLIGRLTQDPELRYIPSGSPVTDLRLATTRTYRAGAGEEGERREETLYIDVTVWNRQAENCCQYLSKGRAVHVEGHLKVESWDDKTTGEKRSKIKVVADNVQFLDSGRREGGSEGGGPAREAPQPRSVDGGESRGFNGSERSAPTSAGPRRAPTPPPQQPEDDIPF